MSISSCPRCSAQVSLPLGAPASARVRCPVCGGEYALHEALAKAPPMLLLVEDLAEDASEVASASTITQYAAGAFGSLPAMTEDSHLETLDLNRQDNLPELGDMQEVDTELEELQFGADDDSAHVSHGRDARATDISYAQDAGALDDGEEIGLAEEHETPLQFGGAPGHYQSGGTGRRRW